MANRKPDLIKINETYIKFDFDFTESNKEKITQAYLRQVGFSSKEIFRSQEYFKVSIEYDKGSLKTRIIVWGTAIYLGVSGYGSFRSGVRELINDGRQFSNYIIERIDDGPNINTDQIIRIERRTGLPGRIQNIYYRIDHLERNINNLSNNQIQAELNSIKQEIANIGELLTHQGREEFLNELSEDFSKNLPLPNDRRTSYLMNRYGTKPNEEIEFLEE